MYARGESLAQCEPVHSKTAVLFAVRQDPCRWMWEAGYLGTGVPAQHGVSPPIFHLDGIGQVFQLTNLPKS